MEAFEPIEQARVARGRRTFRRLKRSLETRSKSHRRQRSVRR